jgi:hypothetical protein
MSQQQRGSPVIRVTAATWCDPGVIRYRSLESGRPLP